MNSIFTKISSSFTRKNYKYKDPNDFKNMTVEEIIKTDPKEIKSNIISMKEIENLSPKQKEALNKLVSIKKIEKELKITPEMRRNYIEKYLSKEKAIDDLLIKVNNERLDDQIFEKDTKNGLNRIGNLPEEPYTEEEELYLRNKNLKKKGGKRNKTKKIKKDKKDKK